MVRALLEGRKTQTRRILNPQPFVNGFHFSAEFGDILCHNDYLPPATLLRRIGKGQNSYVASDLEDGPEGMSGIYVGDRLFVRETWRTHRSWDETKPREILACSRVWYEADRDNCDQHGKVRVSIHMPRWASRLTLIVTEVRVERLNDCSEADALAEGVRSDRALPDHSCDERTHSVAGASGFPTAVEAYRWLWDSINGRGAWEANPWVVAVSFAVVRRNIDQC